MKRLRCPCFWVVLSSLLVFTSQAFSQTLITGNLTTYVDNFIAAMPSTYATNEYQAPSPVNLTTWGNIVSYMLQENYSSAQALADSIGYRIIKYTDNSVTPNKTYYILEKKSTSTNYWGMFIYNPTATRKRLFIQSPHPKFDTYTGKQGFYIFSNLNCRAFFITGTHRCNNGSPSPCDGTSTVCTGSDDPYRLSDQAHNVNGTLQRTTEICNSAINNLIIIQPHGFAQDTGDPDAIMSNGTRTTPSPDYLTTLKNNMLLIDDTLTFKIMHKDLTWTKLAATDNTQGRLLNGSGDPCGTAASVGTGRFLHVEQALKLRDTDAGRKKLSDGLAATFGIDGLTLTAPNGNQTLTAGNPYTITWSTTGLVSRVRLEYAANNGSTWNTIIASTNNTGSYSWTVPNVGTWRGKVRVIDADYNTIGDTSSATFKISCSVYPTTGTMAFADAASAFGPRKLNGVYDFHRGMDFPDVYGTPIHPALPGIIVRREDTTVTAGSALQRSGSWILVRIDSAAGQVRHNAYLHMSAFYKYNVGDTVSTADTIGFMGMSGYQINTVHCHFELYKNLVGTNIDKDKSNNPIEVLPFNNISSSKVSFVTSNDSTAVQVSTPDTELDFNAITIYGELATRTVDFNARTGIDPVNNDNPAYNNVLIDPDQFVQDSSVQRLRFWLKNSEIGTIDSVHISDVFGNTTSGTEYSLGPRYAVITGNYSDAIWAATSNGAAGSASLPVSVNSITINSNVTVTINTSGAECSSVSFAATTSKLSFAVGSQLSVYGDFTLASTTHQAVSNWVAGAKLRFAGTATTQTLSGWSTSAFSTGLDEVIVDKPSGKVVTSGSMRLQIGTSLEIVNGTFELASTSGLEGRNYAGSATSPAITIQANGIFNMVGSSSFIRRASNTPDETSKIGTMTVYGTAYLASSSTFRINFAGISIENGGTVEFPLSRSTASSTFNPGVITVKNGGTFRNRLTTGFWYNNTTTPPKLILNSGGLYECTASSTSLPQGGVTQNSGCSIKFTSGLATTLPSGIASYKTLMLSGDGTKSLSVNTTIEEALQLSGTFDTLLLGSYTLTYNASAVLRYGASGQTTPQLTRNAEWPASGGPQNVEIYNGGGVTLHANRTVSGAITLTNGLFFLGNNSLTIGASGSIVGTPASSKMVITNGTGKLIKSILNGSALPYSFTFPLGDSSGAYTYSPVTCTLNSGTLSSASISAKVVNTKHASNTSSTNYINRYWTLTPSGINSPNYTAWFTYGAGDVSGSENGLAGGLYTASNWINLGSVVSSGFTATNQTAFGDYTAGESIVFSNAGNVSVKIIPQGYYNGGGYLNSIDTLKCYLANANTPYAFVDSCKSLLDSSSFTATATFNKAATGSYYIVIKHRSSVETWSASTVSFVKKTTVSYDFTDAQTKAYGNNLVQVSASPVRWAMYSGDCNQDGYVDPLDVSLIDQDSFNYVSGSGLNTDLNGDHFVDPLDMAIADLNSFNYVGLKRPATSRIISPRGRALQGIHYLDYLKLNEKK